MLKFTTGVLVAVAVSIANSMIDGVWLAQAMLFAAGFAFAAVILTDDN